MLKLTAPAILARDVYRAPYLREGCEVFVAIDRRGNHIAEVSPSETLDTADKCYTFLRAILDEKDPEPVMRLVTS